MLDCQTVSSIWSYRPSVYLTAHFMDEVRNDDRASFEGFLRKVISLLLTNLHELTVLGLFYYIPWISGVLPSSRE
jgi:hypothetical protein